MPHGRRVGEGDGGALALADGQRLPVVERPPVDPPVVLHHRPGEFGSQCDVRFQRPEVGGWRGREIGDCAYLFGQLLRAECGVRRGAGARRQQGARGAVLAFGGGEAQTAGGMFVARTQTQNATAMQVAQLMRDELLRAGREEAPAAELAARQATLVGSFTRQLETTGGLADQVASQWFQGRPLEALGRYVDEVLAVTPAQVREYAERHWRAEALRTVVAGDVPPTAADAGRRVPIAALDLEQPALTR